MKLIKKIAAGVMVALSTQTALAEAPATAQKTQFVRFIEDGRGGGMLETAATTYRNGDGVTVTLIGAVHIADPEYFEGLDASFDHYDALLYEMVKPTTTPGAATKPAARRGMLAWVGPMQRMMKDQLHLAFQMEGIEYEGRKNFVHADLDSDTFFDMQEERNEGFFKIFLRAWARETGRRAGKGGNDEVVELSPFQLFAALRAPDRPRQLKLLFARQMEHMDAHMSIFEGKDGSVIITERNKKALAVLDEQIAAGKKNIGVFYGAGHFPDMEKRMKESGFEKIGQTWRTAWDMRASTTQPSTRPS